MQYYANKNYSIHSTKYRENFNQVHKFMAVCCRTHAIFSDDYACLMADNIWNEGK
jgi:hypothetical protein